MNDNLRMIIGFALVVLILILWQVFFPPRRPTVPAPPAPVTDTFTPAVVDSFQKPVTLTPALPPPPETTVTVENRFLRAELTSIGGALKSCSLKTYQVQLVPEGERLLGNFELENAHLAGITVDDSSVTFTYELNQGMLHKTWILGQDYTFHIAITSSAPGTVLTFDARAGIPVTEKNIKEDLANFHFYGRNNGRVHQVAVPSLRKKPFSGTADWVGLKSKYFFLTLVAQGGSFDSVRAEALADGRAGFVAPVTVKGDTSRFLVYAGPIEYNRLRRFGLGFEGVVSLGWLKPVALGILYLLRLFYQLVRNWGVAIVLFSLLMKGIFYPLSRTQIRQMRQLQLLQPKIEELKKKYKDNPQLLNQETMRLYQLYKVNPLSGCLPLLVQMPVFFALYAVLRNFIELRGAGFALWLKDLSQPDTLFGHIPAGVPLLGGSAIGLLPILMGVSFIAQNLITATDRRNWAMTIIFPLFITAIFLNLSSGLQLYWFVYNILSIGESLIATKGGKIWQKKQKSPNLGVS